MSDPDSSDNGPWPQRPPQNRNEWGILWIIGGFFGLFIAIDLLRDFGPAKLSVLFFLLSWVVLLAMHEFGHAAAARALGWSVRLVSIGSGRVRMRLWVAETPVEIRTIPLSGFVLPRPTDLRSPRLKQFLVFAAGPGIELLLVALLAWGFGVDTLLRRTPEVGLIAVQSFCVAALLGSFINLLPFPHRTGEGTAWSDGLGMVLCWTLPDEWFRRQMELESDSPLEE